MNEAKYTGSALEIARRQTVISLGSVTETLGRYDNSLRQVVQVVVLLNKQGNDTGALAEALTKADAILARAKSEIEDIIEELKSGTG